jgi:iron-sulfur cluster repair protein YtfE (RIC family)
MKRHESIAPLSRDHHEALILAQLLKSNDPNYKGLPTTVEGKATYAIDFFHQKLWPHFQQEEQMLALVQNTHVDIDDLSREIIAEHESLVNYFKNIITISPDEVLLNNIGVLLEQHIRKEERQLFPLLQQFCTPAQLTAIHDLLH